MKNRVKVFTIILLFLLLGCGKKNKIDEVILRQGLIYEVDGELPFTGKGGFYYDKDHLASKGKVVMGRENDTWEYFFYSGKLRARGRYKFGKKDGRWNYYNYDGTLEGSIIYRKGKEIEN